MTPQNRKSLADETRLKQRNAGGQNVGPVERRSWLGISRLLLSSRANTQGRWRSNSEAMEPAVVCCLGQLPFFILLHWSLRISDTVIGGAFLQWHLRAIGIQADWAVLMQDNNLHLSVMLVVALTRQQDFAVLREATWNSKKVTCWLTIDSWLTSPNWGDSNRDSSVSTI